jgi:putative hemolysin
VFIDDSDRTDPVANHCLGCRADVNVGQNAYEMFGHNVFCSHWTSPQLVSFLITDGNYRTRSDQRLILIK